jgi:hypothetical protein
VAGPPDRPLQPGHAGCAQAGLYKGLGDLGAQQGRDEAGIYGNFAGQRAGIHTGVGAQEAGALQGYTGLHAQNIANLTNNVIGAGTGAMMAGQQAAANRTNLGMQGLQLGASLLGGAGGIGGVGKAIGGLFGGGLTAGAGGLY